MTRVIVWQWLLLSIASSALAAEFKLNGHTFTLPDGFDIELVGSAPVVNRPISADFDDRGRLYVTDSSGTNDKSSVQLETRPHRILRLEDSTGDGVFDKSTVFADKMMFPEGAMWYDGSLYVAAPPSIWKLTDSDDDGTADLRQEWYQGKTLTGCANDLHGPYLGLDGWVYWCKGAFAEQTHQVQGRDWKTKASHIFRCRPDGSDIEPVLTGGMDNPVDVVFTPSGDRILSNTFIVHPGNGLRDGLLHAIYGGVYGKDHGVLEGHPRTGELMPILTHMGPAAACGLVRYESTVFGDDFRDNLFCCQFNKRLVSRHVLTASGASFVTQDSDFVLSDNTDFHPTDIIEDADGSLLIVDTGGWYKLCCPSSQLHKPDILGGIYRVRKQGTNRSHDPRGLSISWQQPKLSTLKEDGTVHFELAELAADERPAVRRRAVEQQARLELNEPLMTQGSPGKNSTNIEFPPLIVQSRGRFVSAIQEHLWAWGRVAGPKGLPYVRGHLTTAAHEGIRHVALQLVSLYRDRESVPSVLELLRGDSSMNRRLAAETLGRVGAKSAVPALLEAARHLQLADPTGAVRTDRVLEHAIIYALIEIADPTATTTGLTSENTSVQRAALIALDQMAGGGVPLDQVLVRLESDEPVLRETASWLIARHPEWGGGLAGWFERQLAGTDDAGSNAALESLLVQHAGHAAIQQLLANCAQQDRYSVASRRLALQVMAQARPAELPTAWGDAMAALIQVNDQELTHIAVAAARDLPQGKRPHAALNAALRQFADNPAANPSARVNAMAAVHGGLPAVSSEAFELLIMSLDPDRSVAERSAAADAIAKAQLTAEQLLRIAAATKTVGPLELDQLLSPFERSTDEAAGLLLLDALKKASALSSLRIDSLRQRLGKYGAAVQERIPEVEALVNVDAAAQRQQLEARLATISSGDVRRGQAVFNSTKAACVACHRFGYLGGNAGPDLTRIGGIRTERDLLESILFPNLSFVRSYEPVNVVTTDGRVVNGLIRNETSSELLIATGPNQEVRLARADVEEIRPSTVSVMPAGLDKQLSEQEMADLIAFLKNAK